MSVGYVVPSSHRSHFFRHRPAKPDGVVRIGIFGCSFVFGSEAPRDQDLGSLLEDRFRKSGLRRVEVLNFGQPAYGLQQSFFLWRYLSRRYAIDYVVFAGVGMHLVARDTTFSFDSEHLYPIHARYIQEDHGPVLIPPAGASTSEALGIYHDLLPAWRYLRYDRRAPAAIRMWKAHHTTVSNPFYYRAGLPPGEELAPIYAHIIDQVAKSGKDAVFVIEPDARKYILPMAPSGLSRVSVLETAATRIAPDVFYRAMAQHPTALANQLRAEELFAFLTGRPSWRGRLLALTPDQPPERAVAASSLHEWADGRIVLGKKTVAALVEDGVHRPAQPVDLRARQIGAIVLLNRPGIDPDPVFLPLRSAARDGEAVSLLLRLPYGPRTIPVGRLRRWTRGVYTLELTQSAGSAARGSWRLLPLASTVGLKANPEIAAAALEIGEERFPFANTARIRRLRGPLLSLKALTEAPLRDPGMEGWISLRARKGPAQPLFRYTRSERRFGLQALPGSSPGPLLRSARR